MPLLARRLPHPPPLAGGGKIASGDFGGWRGFADGAEFVAETPPPKNSLARIFTPPRKRRGVSVFSRTNAVLAACAYKKRTSHWATMSAVFAGMFFPVAMRGGRQ